MIGTTLAHYQIIAHLGTGGMGEVYRATDTKLGREVALKLLPEAVSRDLERVARFEREARTLATLQQPNVASICGLEQRQLAVVDRRGSVITEIGEPMASLQDALSVSPAEDQIVVPIAGEAENLWIYEVESGARRRFTFEGYQGRPQWFPEGNELMYTVGFNIGDYKLERRKLDGSAPQTLDIRASGLDLSRDGQVMVFTHFDHSADPSIYWSKLDEDMEPQVLIHTDAMEERPRLSPDDRFVAYQSNATGRIEIYVQDFPQAQRKWQVSQNGGTDPRWSHDGSRLYFRQGPRFYEAEVRTEPSLTLGPPKVVFENADVVGFEVSEDPDRFFVVMRETRDGKMPSIQESPIPAKMAQLRR